MILGLIIGAGVGFVVGEILVAIGAPFITAHAMLVVCALIGGVVGHKRKV